MEIIKLIMLNFSDKCKKYFFKIQVQQQRQRVEKVLKTTQVFLAARNHQDLYVDLQETLPQTLGYEYAGVLFYEELTDSLYWIYGPNLRKLKLKPENVIRLPYSIGLTGQAISLKKCKVFQDGDGTYGFVKEIDNIFNIQGVQNLLVCPFFDDDGRIKGVIQLINKIGADRIPDQDVTEISSICPSLSHVLQLCDNTRDVTNISAGMIQSINPIEK